MAKRVKSPPKHNPISKIREPPSHKTERRVRRFLTFFGRERKERDRARRPNKGTFTPH
ncbi:hypothetical protein CCACVL1_21042 [Corchorus capsularis]|uniref:Uncharacterized protein n=1 Tax=Corchorus capsularis TaxID=210143 RepID=A0A1R3H8G9_COCAP|nr:hypothetical protein CCACVL1_21042 [Corchorus capsularis]